MKEILTITWVLLQFASDLVDCKNEYKNIISNLLGRVVIVEDMDSAIGISKDIQTDLRLLPLTVRY